MTKLKTAHKRATQGKALEPSKKEMDKLVLLYGQGQLAQAEALSRSLTERFPKHGFGWKVLGAVMRANGRPEEAVRCMREAARLMPQDSETLSNLATGLQTLDRGSEAKEYLQQALNINPNFPAGHFNLGSLARMDGDLVRAEASLRQAVALDANYADAYVNLGMTLQNQGRTTEAVDCYRNALRAKPDYAIAFSNLLFALSHDLWTDPKQLFAEHCAFGDRFEAPLRPGWKMPENIKDPDRTLQVGFVSADLHGHAVATFIGPVLEQLTKNQSLQLHAYYNNTIDDAVSAKLRTYFAHWHPVAALSEEELAIKIRVDHIDILIDLSGHTARNRLLTFARKPAPIQASWIGYPGTTGLTAVDYYLCERFYIPEELSWQFTEKCAWLPTGGIFSASPYAPPVNSLPMLKNGYVTFGSFNRHEKINDSVIGLWSTLLLHISNAKIIIGATPMDQQEVLFTKFEKNNIERNRIAFMPRVDMPQYLGMHHHIDICLDTFPYGGGTTVAHAAWMGIPTLILTGETAPTRQGAIILNHLNLKDFVATSIEDYIAKGCYWANHSDQLTQLRSLIRDRFSSSILMQPDVFSGCLANAFRVMWKRWCTNLPTESFEVNV
jgi:predicted O-linked N-acetylglucosamine transferase (SPINDLY family)